MLNFEFIILDPAVRAFYDECEKIEFYANERGLIREKVTNLCPIVAVAHRKHVSCRDYGNMEAETVGVTVLGLSIDFVKGIMNIADNHLSALKWLFLKEENKNVLS